MNRMTVTLPVELDELVRKNVQSGSYASSSEVIRDALRLWRDHNDHTEQLVSIRQRIRESIEDPHEGYSTEEVEDLLVAHHKKRLTESTA